MTAFALMTYSLPLALIGDIGGGELLVVLAATLMLFGGKKLPSIARTLGKAVADLRRASEDFREQLMNADRELGHPFEDLPSPTISADHRVTHGDRSPEVVPNPVSLGPLPAPPADNKDEVQAGAGTHGDVNDPGTAATAPLGKPPFPETTPRDLAG